MREEEKIMKERYGEGIIGEIPSKENEKR